MLYIKSDLNGQSISFFWILCIKTTTWLFWGCWIPFIFYLSHKVPIHKHNYYLGVLLHLPISIMIVCFHLLLYVIIIKLSPIPGFQGQPIATLFIGLLFSQFEWYFLTYWALMLGSYAVEYYQKFRESNLKAAQLDSRLTKSRLMALKMQLHPHFLFNTLHTISSLVRQDEKKKSISMLSEMGDLLRIVLSQNEEQFIKLTSELEFIKKYIALEEKRFKNKMNVQIEVGDDLSETLIPSFLLQPLIENSIYHGLSKKVDASILSIDIKKKGNQLCIEMYNDGPPLSENFNVFKVEGIGLANTIERLSQLYQDQYIIKFLNIKNGVLVKLNIPYQIK